MSEIPGNRRGRGGREGRRGTAEVTGELVLPKASSVQAVNAISGQVVDAAMRVHSKLGPGLLESAYQACLTYELCKRGLNVRTQVRLPIVYDGVRIGVGYRLDLLVEEVVIVETKALASILPVHEAQVLSYLKLSGCQVGLVINFHELHLKDGIRRLVNNL